MKRSKLLTLLLGSVSVYRLFHASANAQNAPTAPATETVVVTGSRLITNGNIAPTPVTVMSAGQSGNAFKPTNIVDGLLELRVFGELRVASRARPSPPAPPAPARQLPTSSICAISAPARSDLFDGPRVVYHHNTPALVDARHHSPDAGSAGRRGHGRRLGRLWIGCGDRRGQFSVPIKDFDGVEFEAKTGESRCGSNQGLEGGHRRRHVAVRRTRSYRSKLPAL